MRSVLCLYLLVPAICFGNKALEKAAVLFLPDQIEYQSGSGETLVVDIEFRWDEAKPLHLGVWRNQKGDRNDRVFGSMQVFDKNGHEIINKTLILGIPPIPDGEVTIADGELKRFTLRELSAPVVFPQPGDYYAIAKFGYGICDNREVAFTTSKRWFKAVEGAPITKNTSPR